MSTTFHYTCECGFALPIAASSAGTMVPCRCGKQVTIPKLSELKRLSGQEVEPVVGIADQLRTMYLDKQLPPDSHCVYCQVKTTEMLECWVECERAGLRSSRFWDIVFLILAIPLKGPLFMAERNSDDAEVHGNDLVVRTPLPICENCQHTTSRNSANLRQLLHTVGLYRQLLEKYPHARVGAS